MDKKLLEIKTEEPSEANVKKMVEETIQKWLLLQKTVKEEITLEEIINKQQQNDNDKLKQYFRDFYDLKIKSRKIFEDIRNIKITDESKKTKQKHYYIEKDDDKVLSQAGEPIKNLLFLFRNNYAYITK